MKARTFRFFSFPCALRKSIQRALAAAVILPATAQAQFETDHSYIGAHLGLGSYESGVSFGGDFEYGLTQPGEAGPGRIGIGGTVDYWSWSGDAGYGYSWSYSWVPVGFFGAYHFIIPNRKWDLFAGLGLGYLIVNGSLRGPEGGRTDIVRPYYSNHVYWSGIAGARYFFSPSWSLHGRLGWGVSVLSVGVNVTL